MSDVIPPENAIPVEVNGRINDPHDHYAHDAQNTNYIVLTTNNVLRSDEMKKLQDLKVQFLEDLGNNNFLCRYEPAALEPLRRLEFVRQVDVYRRKFKIPSGLLSMVEKIRDKPEAMTGSCLIDVMLHENVSDLDTLADSLAAKAHVDRNELEVTSKKIRLSLNLAQLEDIASDDRVRILEEVVPPVLSDGQAKHIISSPVQIPGHPVFQGKDQVVAVVDSGFDLGSTIDCHPSFTGRIKNLIPIGRASADGRTEAEKVDDPDGHGTHVCGTIVGRDIETSEGNIGGVAQEARVVLSSLLTAEEGVYAAVTDLKTLFNTPYAQYDARIYSNSWGDPLRDGLNGWEPRVYGDAAAAIDEFVCNHPDALIVFSAGNNNEFINRYTAAGEELVASIGSQAAAKNCLTVGASGSTRTVTDPTDDRTMKLDPDEICTDSSRGPSPEGRIKPDVVAPGFNIFSSQSRHKAVRYQAAEASSKDFPKVLWKVRSGTSHAAPLVSGCAAVLREILQNQGCHNPPAALIKAVIINGADKLPNIDVAAQGFGRINLHASAEMLRSPPFLSGGVAHGSHLPSWGGTLLGAPLKQGETFSFVLTPTKNVLDQQFKVTMVYNDRKGRQIQNNLNLSVIDIETGKVTHGGISEEAIDKQNNVEQVVCKPAPLSPVMVQIHAQKIFPNSEQDFALAWSVSAPYQGGLAALT